ncbi:hypothetical protein AV530_010318 [Patagioenas fasciata monilis]|uniref:Uncharacterized protein n=1 Tax=Patagioenas fasciata monilis TaxID=372326 RepID=A0A1V4KEK3_PATFA|nr:hypothetical protein AV530_010318 [Patagioenas fasciata monilis]
MTTEFIGLCGFDGLQNACHSLPLPGGVSNTPGIDCPRGGNSPTICHGLIQSAMEQAKSFPTISVSSEGLRIYKEVKNSQRKFICL